MYVILAALPLVQMLLTKEEEAVKTSLWLAEHGDYLKEVGESLFLYR